MAPSTTSVTFLGGVRAVTGSKFLFEHRGRRVLLDCGLFQGIKDLRVRNWSKLPVYPSSIDAVVLSHAHLDHCGYVPRLVGDGFEGRVHATEDTAALTSIILPDSGHIQEEDAENANRYGWSRHEPALPLYTEDDARRSLLRLERHGFAAPFEVAPGIQVTFGRAGHILGAATVRIDFDNGKSVVASGDLGRPRHPLLVPPDPVGDADWILVESTYGDRRHDASGIEELAGAIERTIARGGTVIIPSFAVDRTEVLMYHLRHLAEEGRLPPVPIYVDSPMALAALQVYESAFANGSPDVRKELVGRHPLRIDRLEEVHDVDASRRVSELRNPSIIIAASGMATGGRVVHHLAAALPDRRNTVILVGFQAEGTRGRRLIEGVGELKMMGRYIRVRAEIVDLPGFSVHADADELIAWLGTTKGSPESVFVVHGEVGASRALQDRVEDTFDWTAVVPNHGERVRFAMA